MQAPPNATTLGLMTKYWDVGRVKTRLGQSIGMPQAAALHRLFVLHLCGSLASFSGRRVVCLAPDASVGQFSDQLRSEQNDHHWETMPQGQGSLGARMERWFDAVFHRDSQLIHSQGSDSTTTLSHRIVGSPPASQAILIGVDCPTLSVAQIEEAQAQLSTHDVVIGPAIDGGYYLIGISSPWQIDRFHSLFDEIPWSTDQVLRVTRERLSEAGLSCFELEPQEDVDTVVELNRLRNRLAAKPHEDVRKAENSAREALRIGIERILADKTVSHDHSGYKR